MQIVDKIIQHPGKIFPVSYTHLVLKVEGRKSPEREIFTDEQVTLILNQKNTPTGQLVIALLACGVRIYELLHFKHEDFQDVYKRQDITYHSLRNLVAAGYISHVPNGSRIYIFYPNLVNFIQKGLTAEQSLDYQLSRTRN